MHDDAQAWQAGQPANWQALAATNSGSSKSSGGSNATTLAWQPPAGGAWGQPAMLALGLESGAPPSFAWGPLLPDILRTPASFGMTFSLDRAALFVYGEWLALPGRRDGEVAPPPALAACQQRRCSISSVTYHFPCHTGVFRPQGFDAQGRPQSPVLVATGRVPVFTAGQNASTGPIQACPWAPGGAFQPGSTLLVSYVARDKYGRQDGSCPGKAAGATPQVCTTLATTAG